MYTQTPIQCILSGNFEKIKQLTDEELYEKDEKGRCCLHAAASRMDDGKILRYLLNDRNMKQNVNMTDNDGLTAVHYACGQEW